MLRDLMEKKDNMEEQIDDLSQEMDILWKNQKEMLRNQKHCNGNKECFWWAQYLIMTEERIFEFKNVTVEPFKTEKQREKRVS